MDIEEEIKGMQANCTHAWEPKGHVKWRRYPNKSVILNYCQVCLATELHVVTLSEEALERLLNLRISAYFDMVPLPGTSLVTHLLGFTRVIMDIKNCIIEEVEMLPEHLHLMMAPIPYAYLERSMHKRSIYGFPVYIDSSLPDDTVELRYGGTAICEIGLTNLDVDKTLKQGALFPLNDTKKIRL